MSSDNLCNEPASTVDKKEVSEIGTNGPPVETRNKSNNAEIMLPSISATAATFNCELCHISCSSEDVFETHIKGQKHQKKLKRKQEIEASGEAERILSSELYCKLCAVELTSKDHMILHVAGKRHKQNAAKAGEKLDEKPVEEQFADVNVEWDKYTIPEDKKHALENKYDYFCAVCNKYLVGKTQLIMHIRSNKHQSKSGMRVPKPLSYVRKKRMRNADFLPVGLPLRDMEAVMDSGRIEPRFVNYARYQTGNEYTRDYPMERRKFPRTGNYFESALYPTHPQTFYSGFGRPVSFGQERAYNSRYTNQQFPRNCRLSNHRMQANNSFGTKTNNISKVFTSDMQCFPGTANDNFHMRFDSTNSNNYSNQEHQNFSSSFANDNNFLKDSYSSVDQSSSMKIMRSVGSRMQSEYDTISQDNLNYSEQQSGYGADSGKYNQYSNVPQSNYAVKQESFSHLPQNYTDSQQKPYSTYSDHKPMKNAYVTDTGGSNNDFYSSNQYSVYKSPGYTNTVSQYDLGYGTSGYNNPAAAVPSSGQSEDGSYSNVYGSFSSDDGRGSSQHGFYAAAAASVKKEF